MEHYHPDCGYILGNQFNYPEFEQVFTIDLFFKRFFQGELPHYDVWIIGQGLSAAERQMLFKLQSVCPSLIFSNSAQSIEFTQDINLEKNIELQHFYVINPLHYQAELYVLSHLTPSVFLEGLNQLLQKGLSIDFPGYDVFLRSTHLLQIRRLLPLALSVEVKLEDLSNPNTQFKTFRGKARFYQENYCMAEMNIQFDLEKSNVTKKHANQAVEKIFSKERVGWC